MIFDEMLYIFYQVRIQVTMEVVKGVGLHSVHTSICSFIMKFKNIVDKIRSVSYTENND